MTLQYHKKNFPKEKSPANGHQKITTAQMTENSGGPAKTAHARPLPSLCPPFARAHCSAPFHSAPQLRGSQRSRSANRQFFSEKFPRLGSKLAAPPPAAQGRFFTGNKFPMKTAIVFFCVCGGSSRENNFLRKTAVSKKHNALRWKSSQRLRNFSAVQSRRQKTTFTAAFSKNKIFSQYSI